MGSNHFSIRVVILFILWPYQCARSNNQFRNSNFEFSRILLKESDCFLKEIVAIKKINHKDLQKVYLGY